MPTVIESLRKSAHSNPRRIIFPESSDPRIVQAAIKLAKLQLGQPVLVVTDQALVVDLPAEVETVCPSNKMLLAKCAAALYEHRKHKGLSLEGAQLAAADPLLFAALLVKIGFVDASVAGSLATTASVIRAGLYGIGTSPGRKLVSSFFLMQFPDRCWTYADCGVVPDPTAAELAEIAITSADNHRRLTGEIPRIAMLSFSTRGSADHPHVQKIRAATQLIRELQPALLVDGELQFDAAIVPDVAARKAAGSPVAGQANVFVFPDLDAGNIAYKITERLGGAQALGPLIQGLSKPFMDLSRGCSVDDIVDVAVIASALASP